MTWQRTHTCGELTIEDQKKPVILNGWVSNRRDLGGLIFIDLRDKYGITQIVINEKNADLHKKAEHLRSEFVIGVKGIVSARDSKNVNKEMATGEIEIHAEDLIIYSKAEALPFEIKDGITTGEELRLRHRYLDLRRPEIQKNLILRSKLYHTVRSFYHDNDFTEVETPVLMRSTPEGARDYLVPSRVNPGKFFALPQSPQTYKQILMVSGFDRYFQIVKCFRDEDLRADRQPEFTQIDVELSFPDEELIYSIHEELMAMIWKKHLGVDVPIPFPRITYKEAMETYGSDKPDTRFDLEIKDLSDVVANSGFKIFDSTVAGGGKVLAITIPGEGEIGRGAIDRLTERIKEQTGASGLIYMKYVDGELTCNVGKFLTPEIIKAMGEKAEAVDGDLVLIMAGPANKVYTHTGTLRLMMGREHELIDEVALNFLWVTEFPLVEWVEEDERFYALHHPFTAPKPEDVDKMDTDPAAVNARAYDLVLNGNEIGGGSIRIHDSALQQKMFDVLGISKVEAEEKFGFLLKAFTYGAPPHGGIALGLDRIVMLMTGAKSLRDVIAFPKNQKAQSPMDNCPDVVEQKQLDELHIALNLNED